MNSNKSKIKIITNIDEWHSILTNDMYKIHNVFQFNKDILQIVYSDISEMHVGSNQTNVPLAVFTTAIARLILFRDLNKLGKRVLYYDTDSICFISDPEFKNNKDHLVMGDYLGQYTDELGGNYITEFVSSGPKCYAKLLNTGASECVVKGFTLNHIANLTMSFDAMKDIVLEENEKKINIKQSKINRDKKTWSLNSSESDKYYGMTYDKRVITENFLTFPYGYKLNN